ncbi:MAG: Crp/Fnr family transcriptional regulator [Bacteroidales bacterium]|jgi:CRP/FNR family transcriptional regulator|nr:Crp/Fnr family transcriptional regulator [Bacteroidales bacterium]
MRLTSDTSCSQCASRCDFYDAFLRAGKSFPDTEVIRVRFRKHERICRQGDSVSHAIYLTGGTAKLYIEGINGRNIILYLMRPPSYIGLLSFFESIHYTYSVTAIEDAQVCMIGLESLKQLYLEDHEVLLKLNRAFGKSVALIMNKIICLNQKNIRGRIAESLLSLAAFYGNNSFHLPVTRRELGEMSAISEENTVRLLTELKNENIIRLNGRAVDILDTAMLKKISELG